MAADVLVLDAGLAYAERGWSVLPVRASGKMPLTARGVKDAATDPETIRSWWSKWPSAGVAIATGGASGIAVLDVDLPDGEASLVTLEAQHGKLPPTLEARTLRGGRHLYFLLAPGQPARCSVAKLGPALDVRGEGGYVVAPPSPGYTWTSEVEPAPLPAWLAALIGELAATVPDASAPDGDKIYEGERNTRLASLAGTMRRRGMVPRAIEAGLLAENVNRCDPPLPEIEVRRIAASVARYDPAPRGKPAPPREAPQWPAPLAPEAFHGLAGDIVRAIEPDTEADPGGLLLELLLAYGSAVGRGPCFRVEADLHRANLFAVLVGETSVSRKGTSWGHIYRILQHTDPELASERVMGGLSSGEGLIWCVRDPIEKPHPVREKGRVVRYEAILEDAGITDKRALIVESEFSSSLKVMAREGSILSAVMRDAWDRGDLRTLVKNSPARATGAHISILGHITRGELVRHLTETEMGNGFANRFLWICVRRSKYLPDGGHFHIEDHPGLVRRLKDALKFGEQERELWRTEDARAIWHEVYPRLSEGRTGLVGSVVSRAPAQVVRLSLIYALLDCSPEIRPEHLLAALAVWDYCEASARYIFGDSLGYPEADRVLEELRRTPEGLTRTEIRDLFGRNRSEAEIQAALNALAERGLAACSYAESGAHGGRPAEVWKATGSTTKTT